MKYQVAERIASTAPYAFAEIDKKVNELKAQGVQVIDFGVGDPKSPTPDFLIDTLTPAGHECITSGYPSYIGNDKFRASAARYLQRKYGVNIDPTTEISSTIGSKEAVFHFPLAYVQTEEDVVICPTPGYPPYKTGTRFAGGTPYFVPLLKENNFLIDFESIPADICTRAKVMWTNYPNSPTGALAPRKYLENMTTWAQKNNIVIAADEGCYDDIYFDEKPVSILEVAKQGIITFYSMSKRNNMTGYRAGFVAGDAEIIAAFRKVKTNIDSGTPNFVQSVAAKAMDNTTHAAEMREEYAHKKNLLMNAFAQAGLPVCDSDATFYLWQQAPEGKDCLWLADKFLEQGIVVTPGSMIADTAFDGSNPGENYVRFALVPTPEEIKDACARIGNIDFS